MITPRECRINLNATKLTALINLTLRDPGVSEGSYEWTYAYLKYNVWWVRWISVVAITFGHRIYYANYITVSSRKVILHEMRHVMQYTKMGFTKFILTYLWQWVKAGFHYSKIPLEVEAFEYEKYLSTVEFKIT